ncbi:MAG: elongation factor Ts [Pseudomonadota bacterium]|nr:elongation factor Ts [Pseudomonadota bacterium]QKK06245.1 MAG: elongation factor Ts [Pseudomonadota bacterium]|tara:strand:- start:1887 stop:2807 length:921 start_codon:yes stop_codon:yes gene_type:complete
MAEITAAMVKELRERSGAGMMDCKKALGEAGGDMEAAIDWLRKKGLAAAAKKSGRVAAEGLVAITTDGKSGAVVELNAETDFVARNEQFQKFVVALAKLALTNGETVETLKTADMDGETVESRLTDLIATIGENMQLRRAAKLSVENGVIASYMHNALIPGAGKIGVLVALESTADADKLAELGRQLAMHIAAARPEALNIADVDSEALDRERAVLKEQALASGKPADIVEKMMDGRIRKYYEQVVLLEQTYVIDGESKVSAVLEKAGKDLGADVKLTGYVRYELGEGVEKGGEDDFAAEVASMAG